MGRLQEKADELAPHIVPGGPRAQFEQVGRLQLICLLREGLEPHSKVLDVGCGCLRAGYWLIHFLEAGCYFGIEPNQEMLELGREYFLEPEILAGKQPHFDTNDRFDLSVFDVQFDFVLARSIWTHASRGQIRTMLDSFVKTAPGGVMLTSNVRAGLFRNKGYLGEKGHQYLVRHRLSWIRDECAARGLSVMELPHSIVNRQIWLRIEHASAAEARARSTPPARTGDLLDFARLATRDLGRAWFRRLTQAGRRRRG